ncbi:MAG: hypothetical protein LBK69_00485, partial [Syntrophomonadaceae bacterium]|nr:hypothetical protein [Syntrophomonadaceae bacterium]
MMLSIYVSFIVAYFTLYFWGYPVKVLLLNGDLKKFDLYITPWLGIGVIITVLFPLSWLGFSVESVINYFLAAMILLNASLWLKYREPMLIDRKEALLIFSVGFAVASIYFSIIFMHDFEYYAVSFNGDITSYLVDARAALVSSAKYLRTMPAGVPNIDVSNLSLNSDFRGCLLVMAHFAALFKLDLAHIIYPLTAF